MPTKAPTPCGRCGHPATYRGLCQRHAQRAEKQRGTRQARGYDRHHDTLRARYAPIVATGQVTCWRCHQLITTDQAWDLGHHDDRSHAGPEHAGCNRATKGRPPASP